jgi:hypothetical protein
MTDLEKLKAARNAALDVAYARYNAAVDTINDAYATNLVAAYHAYDAALAAKEQETDQ